ncbi:MAG: HPr-rel-A system PqqD family peptide chaperone [Magnetococcales bacterium]|nr:HPr-rel-A system PqqD family peptide chaperone [Magnetococcales bacterium]NGZ26564.1 HPr-rel-A system PqqD family peptide chaperone [Magnetococcales bacterium]
MLTFSHIRWHLLQPDDWLKSRQGTLTVVHNLLSADTHLLNDLAMEILQVLEEGSASFAQIQAHMGIGQDDREECAALARILWQLDHLGLITPELVDDAP